MTVHELISTLLVNASLLESASDTHECEMIDRSHTMDIEESTPQN